MFRYYSLQLASIERFLTCRLLGEVNGSTNCRNRSGQSLWTITIDAPLLKEVLGQKFVLQQTNVGVDLLSSLIDEEGFVPPGKEVSLK